MLIAPFESWVNWQLLGLAFSWLYGRVMMPPAKSVALPPAPVPAGPTPPGVFAPGNAPGAMTQGTPVPLELSCATIR